MQKEEFLSCCPHPSVSFKLVFTGDKREFEARCLSCGNTARVEANADRRDATKFLDVMAQAWNKTLS